jgi:hypothetical protein
MTTIHRKKAPDVPLHVTYQNMKDSVANDQRNCTFGQCAVSRECGMEFYINPDPLDPDIFVEWTSTGDDGSHFHHRGRVVRRHKDGRETVGEAITIVSVTDRAKKALLKHFPARGMGFTIADHTIRRNAAGGGNRNSRPDESSEEREERLQESRNRTAELARARELGIEPPAAKRHRRTRARFGGEKVKAPAA